MSVVGCGTKEGFILLLVQACGIVFHGNCIVALWRVEEVIAQFWLKRYGTDQQPQLARHLH